MGSKLDAVLAAVNKEHGEGTMMRASQVAWSHLNRVPTGIFGLDVDIGGGTPKGRTIQVVGEESTGKTTLALYISGQYQHTCRQCMSPFGWYTDEEVDSDTGEVTSSEMVVTQDCPCGENEPHVVVYADSEGTLDPVWASHIGVDVPALYYVSPEYGEQSADVLNAVIRTGEVDFIVVDSVAVLTPGREVEESAESGQRPDLALLMNRLMRTMQASLNSLGLNNDKKPSIMLINQFREKIGVMYGDPRTWPGGKGQNYAASILIALRSGEYIDYKGDAITSFSKVKGNDVYGRVIHYDIKKNKTFPPHKKGSFKLFSRDLDSVGASKGGVNNFEMMVEYGVHLGLIDKGGSWYDLSGFGDEFQNPDSGSGKFQGLSNVFAFLRNDPAKAQHVRQEIMRAVRDQQTE